MQKSLIGELRDSTFSVRAVCMVLVLAFGGLVTAPGVAAVRQEYKKLKDSPASEDSVAARLASVLVKAQRTLEKATADKISRPGAPERIQLKNLRRTIEKLDKQVSNRFDRIEAHLKKAHLPDVILQRQENAVASYREHIAPLLTALKEVESTNDIGNIRAALKNARRILDGAKFQTAPPPFDPKRLPVAVAKDIARKPATTSETLKSELTSVEPTAATVLAEPTPAYATNDPGNPAYLAATPDVQLTETIKAKAAELGHDPVRIYNWVHNNVEYIPSYGSIQGADQTLATLRGNDFDTASLLIALLRASNIPARYVYGTVRIPIDKAMNWVGGVTAPSAALQLLGQGGVPNTGLTSGGTVKAVRLEHVWVEAWVDYNPSRGARNRQGDTWVPMDASFKQYDYKPEMDIQGKVPFDSEAFSQHITDTTTINNDEGWIQNVDQAYIQNQLNDYQQRVKDFIGDQLADATIGDVLGTKSIVKRTAPVLAASLPYHLVAIGQRMAALPDNLRWKFTFKLKDEYGDLIFSYAADTPALAGKSLALSFTAASGADAQLIASYFPQPSGDGTFDPSQLPSSLPGYLIHLTPQISIGGQTVISQGNYALGTELKSELGYWSPGQGWQLATDVLTAGEYHAIGLDLQGISRARLAAVKTQISDTQAKLNNGDYSGITGRSLTGEILQAGVLSYFAINNTFDALAARSHGIVQYSAPSFGTFKSTVQTVYNFGIPQSVTIPGVIMDIDWYRTSAASKDADAEKRKNYYVSTGPRISAFEHIVPEQLFSTPERSVHGVSAVKALAIAASQGQRIYTITQTDLAAALPQLSVSQQIKNEIQNAVSAGEEVTISQGPINYAGWHGVGYIIQDIQTGGGAYKISGGANGGVTIIGTFIALGAFALIGAFAFSGFVALITVAAILWTAYKFGQRIDRISESNVSDSQKALEVNQAAFSAVLGGFLSIVRPGEKYFLPLKFFLAAFNAMIAYAFLG